ncbi:MAG TPA: gamma-glutamyl-gamma-aminobutyrate hydrolase family protein [Pyrinomonadaceae bacterium]|nr:gamma-glutamyl-gamma-aminobutyrate hydrolase family protein [Pyrinomonadaceae bacterium]
MTARPRIGITMRLEIDTRRFYLGRDYSEAVQGAGGLPVHLPLIPDKAFIEDLVAGLDGVLLPGSDTDVDPAYFGEDPHPRLKKVVPEKDETDLLVLDAAERAGIPIFAICYGTQVLNVFRGGSLFQDIESLVENHLKHEQGIPLDRASHSVNASDSGRLAAAVKEAGVKQVKVNSHHHQAINKIGNDLTATATANDGVIECIEDVREGRWVVGVQWHPELNWRNDAVSLRLFSDFVSACSGRTVQAGTS